MRTQAAIGVFDSGVGGLTVVRSLTERLPKEEIVYLGDTARVPYGSKSAETVVRYSRNAPIGPALGTIKLEERSPDLLQCTGDQSLGGTNLPDCRQPM